MGKVRPTPNAGHEGTSAALGPFGVPWPLVLSAALHALVLAFLSLFVSTVRQPHKTDHPRVSPVAARYEPPEPVYPLVHLVVDLSDRGPYSENARPPFFFYGTPEAPHRTGTGKTRTPVPAVVARHEVLKVLPPGKVLDLFEPDPEYVEDAPGPGQADALSDIPQGGTGVEAALGVGGGGSGYYGEPVETGSIRDSGRRNVANAAADHALDAALRWLVENQEPDGSWLVREHGGSMADDARATVTGLAVLALLGNDHTENIGRYSDSVSRGTAFLVNQQDAQGRIGRNTSARGGAGYDHPIAGLALAESSRLGGRGSTRAAAQKAVHWSSGRHQKEYSGWGLAPASPDCSTAVSVWFILQLRAALSARLKVPGRSFQGAANWLADVEHPESGGFFSDAPGGEVTPASTAGGMLGCLSLGRMFLFSREVELLMSNMPEWEKKDVCYWYHATRAMLATRYAPWRAWNMSVVEVLTEHQRKGGPDDGSWDPDGDPWGERFGRASVTALGAMILDTVVRRELRAVRGWRRELLLKWKAYHRYYVE